MERPLNAWLIKGDATKGGAHGRGKLRRCAGTRCELGDPHTPQHRLKLEDALLDGSLPNEARRRELTQSVARLRQRISEAGDAPLRGRDLSLHVALLAGVLLDGRIHSGELIVEADDLK